LELRDRIIKLSLPLVEAALTKQHMFDKRFREDIRQECILKLITGLPKYDPRKGAAFAFVWTVVCNMSKTVNERLHRPSYSLSSDEDVQKEAEANGKSVFHSPENQQILNSISEALAAAALAATSQLESPRVRVHRKACSYLRKAIVSGDLFTNQTVVIRRLRAIGLDRKNITYYVNYSMVTLRERLLVARQNSQAITHRNYSEPQSIAVLEDL
jgi:hypothetical protein